MQIVQKTFVKQGIDEGKKAANQVAGEILSFFTRNNFAVLDRGETITSVLFLLLLSFYLIEFNFLFILLKKCASTCSITTGF